MTTDDSDQEIASKSHSQSHSEINQCAHNESRISSRVTSPRTLPVDVRPQGAKSLILPSSQARHTKEEESSLISDEESRPRPKHSSQVSFRRIGSDVSEPAATIKQKGKLGKIGGRSKAEKPVESKAPLHNDLDTISDKAEIRVPSRMKDSSPAGKHIDAARAGRASTRAEISSPPRESSRDRANRKREQLKRELELNSSVGAKKKRRF